MLKPIGKLIYADCRDPNKVRKRRRFPNTKQGNLRAAAWVLATESGEPAEKKEEREELRTITEAIDTFTSRTKFTTLAKKTQSQYLYRLNEFSEWAVAKGIYYVYQFTPDVAEKYAQFVINSHERKGIEARIGLVARVFRNEVRRGELRMDPFYDVKKTGYDPPGEILHLTERQLELLLSKAKPRDAAIAVLLFESGMRVNELQKLTWSQVYDSYIDIRHHDNFRTKTDEAGTIPITDGMRMALEYFKLANTINNIVHGKYVLLGSKPAHDSYIHRRLKRLCEANPDVPKCTPQMLRSSLAMYLLDKDEQLHKVQRYLRHKSIKTTERHYGRTMIRHLDSAVEKVQRGHQVSILQQKLKESSQ